MSEHAKSNSRLVDLFDPEPPPHCGPGNLQLWRWIASEMGRQPLPNSLDALRTLVFDAFEEATGRPLSRDEVAPRHLPCPTWWRETAIPILQRRLEPYLWTYREAQKRDRQWGKAGGEGPRPTGQWHAVRALFKDAQASLYASEGEHPEQRNSADLAALLRLLRDCAAANMAPPSWAAEPAAYLLDRIEWGEYEHKKLATLFELGRKRQAGARQRYRRHEEALDLVRYLVVSNGRQVGEALEYAGAKYNLATGPGSTMEKLYEADRRQYPELYEPSQARKSRKD